MTEDEWLSSVDPCEPLRHLEERGLTETGQRKCRLFSVAACRRMWSALEHEQSRQAVEASELYADQLISERDLMKACSAADVVAQKERARDDDARFGPIQRARKPRAVIGAIQAAYQVAIIDDPKKVDGAFVAAVYALQFADELNRARPQEAMHLASLLRCVFGNPFHPAVINPNWLTWNGGTVVKLARTIYDDRRWDIMPILGDALEDAMCHDDAILTHCRGPGPHARGCWVVDLILGKE